MTNEDRADRAQAALDAYIDYTGDRPDESHFRDLLCDLRHLAARDGAGDRFDKTAPAINDESGHCVECGRDNRDHEGEPCSSDCPMYSLTFDEANEMAGRYFEDEQELGKKYVELIPAGAGGPSPSDKHYVGVYTPEDGSIIGECSWHDTAEEARARYDELVERGYEVEDADG
jgi:hypothetical protein